MSEWHFSLSDGVTELGFLCCDPGGRERSLRHWRRVPLNRTAMRTGSGRTTYSDMEPPFYAIAQDDWAGGRGGTDLVDDSSEFWDAEGLQTWVPGRLVLGPPVHEDESWRSEGYADEPVPATGVTLPDAATGPVAQTFQPEATMSAHAIRLRLSAAGSSGRSVFAALYNVTAGVPTTSLMDAPSEVLTNDDAEWITCPLQEPVRLEAGSDYAVVVYRSTNGSGDVEMYGHTADVYAGGGAQVYSGSWGAHGTVADFGVQLLADAETRFFHYRGLLHAVLAFGAGGQILRRGSRGTATGGGRQSIEDTTLSPFVAGDVGETIRIISGTGAGQWGVIASVESATRVLMDRAWGIEPDATSVYAMTGAWESATSVNVGVSDVVVAGEVVYLAAGAGSYVQRYRWDATAGDQVADDGTNEAEELLLFRDSANDPAIWRSLGHEISAAPLQPWGTNLVFGTALEVGSEDERITALAVYDDLLYVGKSGGLWAVQEEVPRLVPADFSALAAPENCRNMVAWNLHLIFPLLYGLERYYSGQLDDFGPNLGEGLPEGRQGPVADILPLPGLLVVAIDAGTEGTSSILAYNSLGWHEIARAGTAGERIRSLSFEAFPDGQARLWWAEGNGLRWVWWSGRNFDRSRDERADYLTAGTLTTAWMGMDMQDVVKLWREVAVFWDAEGSQVTTNPATGEWWYTGVRLDYQLDDEAATWQDATVASLGDEGVPIFRWRLGAQGYEAARRVRFRLSLHANGTETPVVEAVNVEAVGRVASRYAFTAHVPVEEVAITLAGGRSARDVDAVLSQLDAWAEEPQVLTLTHEMAEHDAHLVMLEPVQVVPVEMRTDGEVRRVAQLTLVDLGVVP